MCSTDCSEQDWTAKQFSCHQIQSNWMRTSPCPWQLCAKQTANRQKQIVLLINCLPQCFMRLSAIIKKKLLTGLMAAQTAGIGLLLGTLSGAGIDYLNSNGVKKKWSLLLWQEDKNTTRGAIEVLVYNKISQGSAYTSQPALRNEYSTKILNVQQIKWKTFWNLCLLISDLSTFPEKTNIVKKSHPQK